MRLLLVFGFVLALLCVMCSGHAEAASIKKPIFRWQRVAPRNRKIVGRHGNTANMIGKNLVVIGGCEGSYECYSDITNYNIDTKGFKRVYSSSKHGHINPLMRNNRIILPPRGYHTSTLIRDKVKRNVTSVVVHKNKTTTNVTKLSKGRARLYVFGGQSADGYRNDMYIYDPRSESFSKPLVSGLLPAERAGHSAVKYKHSLYIFGGNSEGGYLKDVWRFDTRLNTWSQLRTKGSKMVPAMAYHSGTIVGDYMYVVGGRNDKQVFGGNDVYVLDLNMLTWSKPLLQGKGPSPRHGVNASLRNNRYIFITGGCNLVKGICYDKQYILDVAKQSWVRGFNVKAGTSPVNMTNAQIVQATLAKTTSGPRNQVNLHLGNNTRVFNITNAPSMANNKKSKNQTRSRKNSTVTYTEPTKASLYEIEESTFLEMEMELGNNYKRDGNVLYFTNTDSLKDFFNNEAGSVTYAKEEVVMAAKEPRLVHRDAEMIHKNSQLEHSYVDQVNTTKSVVAVAKNAKKTKNATINKVVAVTKKVANKTAVVVKAPTTKPKKSVATKAAETKKNLATLAKKVLANKKDIKTIRPVATKKLMLLKKRRSEKKKRLSKAVTIFRNHAGSDFAGGFDRSGTKLVVFGGCRPVDHTCGQGVLIMNVPAATKFQIGLN